MKGLCHLFKLLGRVGLSAIFIFAGIHKFMDYEGTAAYMASKHLTNIPVLLYTAAIVEILGGLSVLLGWKTRWGALLLALFLIPTSYIFHDFWNLSDKAEMQEQMIHFFSNFAIFGGLLFVTASGPGVISIDGDTCPYSHR